MVRALNRVADRSAALLWPGFAPETADVGCEQVNAPCADGDATRRNRAAFVTNRIVVVGLSTVPVSVGFACEVDRSDATALLLMQSGRARRI